MDHHEDMTTLNVDAPSNRPENTGSKNGGPRGAAGTHLQLDTPAAETLTPPSVVGSTSRAPSQTVGDWKCCPQTWPNRGREPCPGQQSAHSLQVHEGHLSKKVHILGHETRKFKSTWVIPGTFSDISGLKPEINNRKLLGTFLNIWKLKNILLNNPWVKEEIKMGMRKYF